MMGMYNCEYCGKLEASPYIFRNANGRIQGPICAECSVILDRRWRLWAEMKAQKAPPLNETGL